MTLLKKFIAVFDKIVDLFAWLSVWLTFFMMFAICTEVISRYFLKSPLTWVVDSSGFILLYITFLGTAWLLKVEGHVNVDIVLQYLNSKTRAFVNTITSIIASLFCLAFAFYGVLTTWDHFQRGAGTGSVSINIPKAILLVVIPIGFFLLSIQYIRRAHKFMRCESTQKDEEGPFVKTDNII
jgi:TRAP-type C4-dicarboxylate transport system permease small subunit